MKHTSIVWIKQLNYTVYKCVSWVSVMHLVIEWVFSAPACIKPVTAVLAILCFLLKWNRCCSSAVASDAQKWVSFINTQVNVVMSPNRNWHRKDNYFVCKYASRVVFVFKRQSRKCQCASNTSIFSYLLYYSYTLLL